VVLDKKELLVVKQKKKNLRKNVIQKKQTWKNCQLIKKPKSKQKQLKKVKKSTRKLTAPQLTMKLTMKKDIVNAHSSTDCGDKECSLSHRFMDRCTIFLHTNVTDCKIPCSLDGCKTETRHFMNCPIWECTSYTTTIAPTTTTSSPNPTPLPNSNLFDMILYSSLGINGFFICALLIFVGTKICKYRRNRRIRNATQPYVPLLPNDHQYFSVAGSSSSDENLNEASNSILMLSTSNQNEVIPLLSLATYRPNYYSSQETSPISLSSKEQLNYDLDRIEFDQSQRELMLARVTTFQPKPKVVKDEFETHF
jgi:hypothetical protein